MAAGEVARSSPRVFGLMVVRDAVDLVRVNALHHFETGLERLLVIDNGSRDGTGELLRELALELPLEVESDPGPFRQADLTNRLAFEARHAGADWVLPIDADEFFVAEARPAGGRRRERRRARSRSRWSTSSSATECASPRLAAC